MITAVMATGLCACAEKTETQTDMDGNGTTDDSFRIQMTRSVPGQYFSQATEQGQVVRIEYDSKDYTREDRTSRISDVMADPAFGDWGRLIFPWTRATGAARPWNSCAWSGTTAYTRTRPSKSAIT